MSYPDYLIDQTLDFKFTTRAFASGIPTTLAGTPAIEVYEDNSTTQITAGETLTVDFDGVTGFNNLRIVATTANGYETGKSYAAVISAGTVDSVSVVGEVVATFSLGRSSASILSAYDGSHGIGVYIDDGAANTSTTTGVDGTKTNPVSTLTAARTIADAIGVKTYYFTSSVLTIAATHEDWTFVGIGGKNSNNINMGSQDIDRSEFYNMIISGTQAGAGRIFLYDCTIVSATPTHFFAADMYGCGFRDTFEIDTPLVTYDRCFPEGTATPIIVATGASGQINIRHYSGGIEFSAFTASHVIGFNGDGLVTFNANVNVGVTVELAGNIKVTDNTAGLTSLITEATYNKTFVNDQVVDVLKTDTITLPGQTAPPLTPTFEQAVGWNYKIARNRKSQTSTQWSLFADDETTVDAKATVSDDGTTAIKQEIVTGP